MHNEARPIWRVRRALLCTAEQKEKMNRNKQSDSSLDMRQGHIALPVTGDKTHGVMSRSSLQSRHNSAEHLTKPPLTVTLVQVRRQIVALLAAASIRSVVVIAHMGATAVAFGTFVTV